MNKLETRHCLKDDNFGKLLLTTKIAFLILFFSFVSASAQEYTVSGTVTDETGEQLIGVSVFVEGTSTGVLTDLSGHYTIKVPDKSATLSFTYIGYKSEKVVLQGQSSLDIQLKPSAQSLDEVVVVGYGSQKKESVTAAISTVSSKELVQSPATNVSNALVGRLSGLTAVQTSGKPGNDASDLYVRGIGTYMGSTAPLVMVDGIARDSYNNIDPNEIETISILKDASATAVFGVRGANGVILITTKRGSVGAPRVSASAQTAVTQFTTMPKFLGSYDYATLKNEQAYEQYWTKHAKDAGLTWDQFITNRDANWFSEATGLKYTPQDLLYFQNSNKPTLADNSVNPYYDPYFHPNVNWQDIIFKNSSRQDQYNINVDGGTDKVKYFASVGYLNQGGMFNTDYLPFPDQQEYSKKRYNFRTNFDFDVTKDFRVSLDLGTNFERISGMNNDDYMWQKRILWSNPVTTPGIVDGKFVLPYTNTLTQNNAAYEIAAIGSDVTNNSTLNSAIKLSQKLNFITEGLSVNAKVSYDSYLSSQAGTNGYTPPLYEYWPNPDPSAPLSQPVVKLITEEPSLSYRSEGYNYDQKWRKLYAEASLNYSRSIGKHDIGAMYLFNVEKKYSPTLDYKLPHAYLGMVSRFTYAYNLKYLAEFNMGYNGSENFPEGKRFGFFPSVSAGWVVTSESFYPKNPVLTYLKIRGSVGKVGNDNIVVNNVSKRYLYLPDVWTYTGSYTFGDLNNRSSISGAQEGVIGNPNVTWETSVKSNIGFESKFWNDKISISYDYFQEHRKDILSYKGTVPGIVQASLPPYNLGEVKNWGHEIELSFRNHAGKLDYWIKGNASWNQNKIIFMDEAILPGLEYQAQTGRRVGQGSYLISDGLYKSWGDLYQIDANGNPDLSKPVRALNSKGEVYTTASGAPVYQKDLGLAGNPVQPGEIKLIDVNEDGVIDAKDYERTGNTAVPEATYGISFGFNYKGFDFSAMFQGVTGVQRFVLNSVANHFAANYSLQEVDLNRFTEERYAAGDEIDFPLAAYNQGAINNTYFLKDASYIRLKNMEIGYTLTPKFLKKIGVNGARIYVNGFNLLTWSKNSIWGDPENLGYVGYPITRTYNMGINFNF